MFLGVWPPAVTSSSLSPTRRLGKHYTHPALTATRTNTRRTRTGILEFSGVLGRSGQSTGLTKTRSSFMDRVTVGHAGSCWPRAPGVRPRPSRMSWLHARRRRPAPCPREQPPQTTPHNHSPQIVREAAVGEVPHRNTRHTTPGTQTPGTQTPGTDTPGDQNTLSPAGTAPATATRAGLEYARDMEAVRPGDKDEGSPGRVPVPPAQLPARPVVGAPTVSCRPGLERPRAAALKRLGPRRRCRGLRPVNGGLNAGEPRPGDWLGLST